MTNEQFTELMAELRTLRAVISAKQSLEASAPKAQIAIPVRTASGEIPMPSEVIDNAETVEVHFGKNKGVHLGSLSPKSLEWYAQEPEPKLKRDGTPFSSRTEDIFLRNAARTIIHQKRGTLPLPASKPVLQSPPAMNSEDIPF